MAYDPEERTSTLESTSRHPKEGARTAAGGGLVGGAGGLGGEGPPTGTLEISAGESE